MEKITSGANLPDMEVKKFKFESPIIVALDGMETVSAVALSTKLQGKLWGVKFNDLLTRYGAGQVLPRYVDSGFKVFADYKFHDIPSTVANHCRRLVGALGGYIPDLVTVHASGGVAMMKAACEVLGPERVAAVTVLTSLGATDVRRIYGEPVPENKVAQLAHDAQAAGVPWCVCSPQEAGKVLNYGLKPICPGIRPAGADADDQKRVNTPGNAIAAGAELLVIGRAITKAEDPVAACDAILDEINSS